MESLPVEAGSILLPVARQAITYALTHLPAVSVIRPPWLQIPGASFVSLFQSGKLRARIGSVEARRALGEDVAANAVSAALHYPGSTPLRREEIGSIVIEVAVLAGSERLPAHNEHDIFPRLRAGEDGLSFRHGHHSSIFLPEAWTQYPTPEDFLAHLKYRAGLPPDFWDSDIDLKRFSVTSWRETAG